MRAIVREAQRLRRILRGSHDHAALTRAIGDTVLAIALHLADGDTSPAAVSSRPAGRGALAPRPGGRVGPATDEDIADDEAMCLCDEPLDWDEECTREAVLSLIARVRREQARADSEERGRHQIEEERDALARRIDDVRAECIEALAVPGPGADGRHDLARLVLDLLDGEAGE